MNAMPDVPRESYMSPTEFAKIGDRLFGFGWQGALARFVGYNRNQINRYACAAEPVPPHIATLVRLLAEKLDAGQPIHYPKPAGHLTHDGRFKEYA